MRENVPPNRREGAPDQRAARLAAALRDNLKRRKAQSRGRQAEAAARGPQDGGNDDGGTAGGKD